MHWIALVEGPNHVCYRYRLKAFAPFLERAGHSLELLTLPPHWWGRLGLLRRLRNASVILQRKLLARWELALLRRTVRHLVFDFDDAVFLRDSYSPKGVHDARRLRRFAATVCVADAVIAGNSYLAAEAARWPPTNRDYIIPTCVDPTLYPVLEPWPFAAPLQLVWVGSSSTLRSLEAIGPLLEDVGRATPGLQMKLICDRFLHFSQLAVVECPWSESDEAHEIAEADVGISWMPDDLWSRGKCGLKVLQYMAAGLPVIANPVGIHTAMIRHGETGFLATTPAEWIEAIRILSADPERRERMGRAGRHFVEANYSVAVGAGRWLGLFDELEPRTRRTAQAEGTAMPKAIELEAGAFHWHILPELLHNDPHGSAAQLFLADGPPLDEWCSRGVAQVVKDRPQRMVYRVVLPGLDFYLKQYRLADARAWLRELVRPSKARLEWERTLAVAERGVPTIAPLAFGETAQGEQAACSFLATRTLPDAVPLNAFLEVMLPNFESARKTRIRQRLAMALGELLAAMHDAGVTQHDLHPGNVLLRLDEMDTPRLHLLDLYAVEVGEPLTWDASRANLVVFNRWFMLRSERSDRLRFWHAYHRCRRHVGGATWFSANQQDKPPEHAEAVRDIERRSLKSNVRFWRALDKRCLGTNRYFRQVRSGEIAGHVVADLPREILQPIFDDPDEPFRRPGVRFLKQSPSSTVIELELPGNDGPRRVIYKRFGVGHWTDPLVALVRRTPALRSYVLGHGLRLRCLPTPRPLGVWHRYKYGLPQEGYLLTEVAPDAVELHEFVNQLLRVGSKVNRNRLRLLIDQLARLIGTLHHRLLSHRDLKASNVLVSNNQLTLIDLVGVMRHRKLRRSRRIQNLARLNVSSASCPGLTRTDKLRFLRVYLRWGLRGRQSWKHWWRAIAQATAAKIERSRRKGRPPG